MIEIRERARHLVQTEGIRCRTVTTLTAGVMAGLGAAVYVADVVAIEAAGPVLLVAGLVLLIVRLTSM